MSSRVLVADDDIEYLSLLRKNLEREQFEVISAANLDTAIRHMRNSRIDVAIFDINFSSHAMKFKSKEKKIEPDTSGYQLIEWAREYYPELRIIVLTGERTSLPDKLFGLGIGADDYLSKPAEISEIVARVRALLRRKQGTANSSVEFGNWHFNPSAYELETQTGRLVMLTPQESCLLKYFIDHDGTVLDRSRIYRHVFSHEMPSRSRAVDLLVSKLRSKMEFEEQADAHIATIHGGGYLFRSNSR